MPLLPGGTGAAQKSPERLVVQLIERETGRTAKREYLPMQPGDVPATYADVSDLARAVDFAPRTSIEDGVRSFVSWLRKYKGF